MLENDWEKLRFLRRPEIGRFDAGIGDPENDREKMFLLKWTAFGQPGILWQ